MSISITSSRVKITNNEYSFEDIYQFAVDNNKTQYVRKLGTYYELSSDLIIESGGVSDSNVQVSVLGDMLQVHKGAHLRLGEKRPNGSTFGSCTLNAPNIKLGYGFGCTTISDSGDLFLYNSTIDIFGFWGFFEGNNNVEIVDCMINGFGRISGANSILKNIIFKQSHGKYGVLSPKGILSVMENLSVFDSTREGSDKCSVYHNPEFANDLKIVGGIYDGYDDLAYIESNSGGDSLVFLDSDILDGYSLNRESSNVDFFHKFTFSPVCRDANGNSIGNVSVVCTDSNGDEVFSSISDTNGKINEEVTYYFSKRDSSLDEIKTPHTVSFSYDDINFSRLMYIDRPYIDTPIYIVSEGSSGGSTDVDYSRIQGMIDSLKNDVCGCVTESTNSTSSTLSTIESGIKQVIREVSDEVSENQTILEKTGFKVVV